MRAERSYHVELKLPGGAETASVDLIVFGPVAKVLKGDKSKVTAPVRVWAWPLQHERVLVQSNRRSSLPRSTAALHIRLI